MIGAEQLLGAGNGDALGNVDGVTAAIIALARVAFGVLVGEHAAHRGQDRGRDVVLAGDEFDAGELAPAFRLDGLVYLRVAFGQDPARIGRIRPRIQSQIFVGNVLCERVVTHAYFSRHSVNPG